MKQPAATVYLVTNLVNGKKYVGVTRFSIEKRWREHLNRRHLRTRLLQAITKYGSQNFAIEPVASCLSIDAACEVERTVIQHLKPEYNQTNGGEFTCGKRVSREVVERIIAKNTGLKRTPEMNKANSEQAKARYASNPEYKAKIHASLEKARACCNEEKRIAAARLANTGKKRTDQERAHLRAVHLGMRHTQEVLDRIAAAKRKPIQCSTLYNERFVSCEDAAEKLGISTSSIYKVCSGARESVQGLCFSYI